MLKLMFIPTGNVFVLPDDEALRIMNTDRGNYKILDGGLQERAEGKLPPETVKELVMQKPQEVIEEEQEKEAAEEERLDCSKLSRNELIAVAKKLDIVVENRDTKASLAEKINKKLGK